MTTSKCINRSYISTIKTLQIACDGAISPGLMADLRREFESFLAIQSTNEEDWIYQTNSRFVDAVLSDIRFNQDFVEDLADQLPDGEMQKLTPLLLQKTNVKAIEDPDRIFKETFWLKVSDLEAMWWGIWSVGYLPFFNCVIDELNIDLSSFPNLDRQRKMLLELSKSNYCMSFHGNICFVCEPPLALHLDDSFNIHNTKGPAIEYRDDTEFYALYGVRLFKSEIAELDELDAGIIFATWNIEKRRVLLKHFGEERFLKDMNADEVDASEYGTLYRVEFPFGDALVMVKVVNKTSELDGTFKSYFLRVPPEITTAREAVAWTFGMTEEEYDPVIES